MSLIKTKKDQFVRDSSYRRREYLNSNISDRDLDKRINTRDIHIAILQLILKEDFNYLEI